MTEVSNGALREDCIPTAYLLRSVHVKRVSRDTAPLENEFEIASDKRALRKFAIKVRVIGDTAGRWP